MLSLPLWPDGIWAHSASGYDVSGGIVVSGAMSGILGGGSLGALEQVCTLDKELATLLQFASGVCWLVWAET